MYSVSIELAPKPSRRRDPTPADYARAIADGEEADRQYLRQYPNRDFVWRAVGELEFQALLRRKGICPPPGLPQPRLYPVMELSLCPEEGTVTRYLTLTDRHTWNRLVRHAHCGLITREEETIEYAIDPPCICRDVISIDTPARGCGS